MQRIKIIDSHTGGEPTRLVVDGFPDLGTRLASAVYHIRLLPAEWSRDAPWDFALRQASQVGAEQTHPA